MNTFFTDRDGRIHAIIQEEFVRKAHLTLPDYYIEAIFDRHRRPWAPPEREVRGRGILVQTGDYEFYLAGDHVGLNFIRRPADPKNAGIAQLRARPMNQLNFLSVEEGHFEGEEWVTDFFRNGDEANFELYVNGGRAVRLRLNPAMGLSWQENSRRGAG